MSSMTAVLVDRRVQCLANATQRLRQFRKRSHFSSDAKRIYEETYYLHASSVVSTVTPVALEDRVNVNTDKYASFGNSLINMVSDAASRGVISGNENHLTEHESADHIPAEVTFNQATIPTESAQKLSSFIHMKINVIRYGPFGIQSTYNEAANNPIYCDKYTHLQLNLVFTGDSSESLVYDVLRTDRLMLHLVSNILPEQVFGSFGSSLAEFVDFDVSGDVYRYVGFGEIVLSLISCSLLSSDCIIQRIDAPDIGILSRERCMNLDCVIDTVLSFVNQACGIWLPFGTPEGMLWKRRIFQKRSRRRIQQAVRSSAIGDGTLKRPAAISVKVFIRGNRLLRFQERLFFYNLNRNEQENYMMTAQCLERKFADRKVRGSHRTSESRTAEFPAFGSHTGLAQSKCEPIKAVMECSKIFALVKAKSIQHRVNPLGYIRDIASIFEKQIAKQKTNKTDRKGRCEQYFPMLPFHRNGSVYESYGCTNHVISTLLHFAKKFTVMYVKKVVYENKRRRQATL
ncbi:hypothetical protein CLF_109823 [Clonorchis sinensis]|uniref:Uncharacterized protein n=1 Tax=Clonorchis sinensis TaxID=79923 RepID=G7YSZ0_CLOSI|nr:hypothetical protein CLF_109823 [Clonorchis sinensis]